MVLLIDRRELLEKARERNLNLQLIEKDYVLGLLLFGFSKTSLAFKGGTALSKMFFPKIWRLSEDLDFSGNFNHLNIEEILETIHKKSGIRFWLKSKYQNPEYTQLKIQYRALLGKNWAKIDITNEKLMQKPVMKALPRNYSDYPYFSIRVMCLEEVFAEKLRALIERKKARDFFDVWKLTSLPLDKKKARALFIKKCMAKGIGFTGLKSLFSPELKETLAPYWAKELSRVMDKTPSQARVLSELKKRLVFYASNASKSQG